MDIKIQSFMFQLANLMSECDDMMLTLVDATLGVSYLDEHGHIINETFDLKYSEGVVNAGVLLLEARLNNTEMLNNG